MLVGKKLGPYVVDKELGSGSMGTVYRARHEETGQKAAVKVMAVGPGRDATVARFQREVNILKQLDHPHIVRLLGSGKLHNQPFFIMEFVDGESLDHVMERRGRISWEEVVVLGQQLCAALQHAHDKGIIHRDLKPGNVMVLKDDTLKLTDFGIAKDTDVTQLTAANHTVGTAAYMSPEQCKGERDLTHKADLYSLGVMLYELVTGRKPLQADTVMGMFLQHTQGTFERPARLVLDIPVWLDTLVCQLLEKDPEKRPLNAETVARALGQIKEKVEAQQSAGMAAATKRRADKTAQDTRLDAKDKEAARALLGKKRKKKTIPFYQRGWFTVTALALVLAAAAAGAYFAFFRAAGAEQLLAQAERLMRSDEERDRKEGREKPIAEFLRRFPDHAQASHVQSLADAYDRDTRERQMHNRRNLKLNPEGKGREAEHLARQALDSEDLGKLDEAKRSWQELVALKTDPDLRPWALVAEKYGQELQAVEDLYKDLQGKVAKEKKAGKALAVDSKEESSALDAMRQEADEKLGAAKVHWRDLKMSTLGQTSSRRWYLLAALRVRQLEAAPK